jgi:hypothetical protein
MKTNEKRMKNARLMIVDDDKSYEKHKVKIE